MMLLYSEFIEILDTGKVMSSIADFLYSTTGKAYNMIQTNWREREKEGEKVLCMPKQNVVNFTFKTFDSLDRVSTVQSNYKKCFSQL